MSTRTEKVRSQIIQSVFFKCLSLASTFALVPLLLQQLGRERYGIWVTLFSAISWILYLDIGLGNGLRNRVAEELAKGQREVARQFISTGYAALTAIACAGFVVLLAVTPFVNWQAVFNSLLPQHELLFCVLITGAFFFLNFILIAINNIFHADQKSAIPIVHHALGNIFVICGVAAFFRPIDLQEMALIFGGSVAGTSLGLSIWYFRKNPDLSPQRRFIDTSRIRSIMSLGGPFFIIQIAALALFTTDKIIILQILGPTDVADYEVALKLFSVALMINTLFLTPLWSGYTNALAQGDHHWIRKTLLKSHVLLMGLFVMLIGLWVFGETILYYWVGAEVQTQTEVLTALAVFIGLRCWCDIYAYFLNGVGRIKVQTALAVVQALTNIPLSIFLCQKYGVPGVIYASSITLTLSAIGLPLHTFIYLKEQDS